MSDISDQNDQKVGYGKPPVHSRFKPGQSGNPKGRPKGQRNFATEVARALAMPVAVTINGHRKNVSSITAIVLRLREKALAGDLKALQMLISMHEPHAGDVNGKSGLPALIAEDMEILREAGLLGAKEVRHGDE